MKWCSTRTAPQPATANSQLTAQIPKANTMRSTIITCVNPRKAPYPIRPRPAWSNKTRARQIAAKYTLDKQPIQQMAKNWGNIRVQVWIWVGVGPWLIIDSSRIRGVCRVVRKKTISIAILSRPISNYLIARAATRWSTRTTLTQAWPVACTWDPLPLSVISSNTSSISNSNSSKWKTRRPISRSRPRRALSMAITSRYLSWPRPRTPWAPSTIQPFRSTIAPQVAAASWKCINITISITTITIRSTKA